MKKILILCGIPAFLLSLCLMNLSFAETELVYVTKTKADLKEGPGELEYKTVAKLKQRDMLEVLETKDDWLKVKDLKSGKTGWIYKDKVSAEKPEVKKTESALGKIARDGDASETANTTAAAGIRPFDQKNYQGLSGDFKSVEQMEMWRKGIMDGEVIEFMKQGKLR
ncbi:MAG: hypothetical protein HY811_05995 [Planctomycetes bacterium]|nr:hypothetical protein [Planctomycetota bacterium]